MALTSAGGAVGIFLAAVETSHASVLANLMLGASTFSAQYGALFARWARITLTENAVVIVDALSTPRTIALAQITGITEGPRGLKISRRTGRKAYAGVVRTPRWAVRAARRTPATRIAEEILTAAAAHADPG